jgi:hypothetical protein
MAVAGFSLYAQQEPFAMCQCFVDSTLQVVDFSQKTWGEILQALDAAAAAEGRVVTVVRFDGVAQPSFRSPELASQKGVAVACVEVETAVADDVLSDTAATARAGLSVISQNVREMADIFRGSDVAGANARLAEVAGVIGQLTLLTAALSKAAGTDLDALHCGLESGADIVNGVGGRLEQLLGAQQARDWCAAADCLEYDLAPAIDRWRLVFDAIEEAA